MGTDALLQLSDTKVDCSLLAAACDGATSSGWQTSLVAATLASSGRSDAAAAALPGPVCESLVAEQQWAACNMTPPSRQGGQKQALDQQRSQEQPQGEKQQQQQPQNVVPAASITLAPPPQFAPPNSSQPQWFHWRPVTAVANVTLDLDAVGPQIPSSFLGISHEWMPVEDLAAHDTLVEVINHLSSWGGGPIVVRVGGASSDMLEHVPGGEVWAALAQLNSRTGVKFILGLNFLADNLELTRAQMDAALAGLPEGAVLAFELGNEPNFYPARKGQASQAYLSCCLVRDWAQFGRELSCPSWTALDSTLGCTQGKFAGPVWGHVHMDPETLEWFLRATHPWLNMTTVHWYKATSETDVTAESLLDEEPIHREAANLAALVNTSNSYGRPLRVAEMNTISNSGRSGVSNVFAAALWTLDLSLEVAAAGATGVNFHWGNGQNVYAAVVHFRHDSVMQPPAIRPAYYAYVMLQRALGAGSRLLATDPAARIVIAPRLTGSGSGGSGGSGGSSGSVTLKVWPLVDVANGTLRIVMINKSPDGAAALALRLPAGHHARRGELIRMVAPGEAPLRAVANVSIAGQRYTTSAGLRLLGAPVSEEVNAELDDGDATGGGVASYRVYLPPGSATLLTIPAA